jgi:transaldolase/glucose-6-phosphate isomerase
VDVTAHSVISGCCQPDYRRDLDKLWDNAKLIEASHENIPGMYHPGISLGSVNRRTQPGGRDKLTIYPVSQWQLWHWASNIAESLGKEHRVIPVANDKIGTPAEYVTDRLFVYLRVDNDRMLIRWMWLWGLREAGHPRATLRLPDKYAIAGILPVKFATSIAGYIMELDI